MMLPRALSNTPFILVFHFFFVLKKYPYLHVFTYVSYVAHLPHDLSLSNPFFFVQFLLIYDNRMSNKIQAVCSIFCKLVKRFLDSVKIKHQIWINCSVSTNQVHLESYLVIRQLIPYSMMVFLFIHITSNHSMSWRIAPVITPIYQMLSGLLYTKPT